MKKSCKYCGKIHDVSYVCPMKPRYDKPRTKRVDMFRKTMDWRNKREEILERDGYMCRLCEAERAARRYNPDRLSVHHIEPISEAWGLRLKDDNLITLCDKHHDQAERGRYSRKKLHELAEVSPRG